MAKLNLNDLNNIPNENTVVASVNANNASIETFSDTVLSRDGTAPNYMTAQLDMNSNRIINLPMAISPTEPVRKEDLDVLTGSVSLSDVLGLAFSIVSVNSGFSVFEVFSKTALQSLILDGNTPRVRLTYPHGSMVLARSGSAPSHYAYVQSADGAYYVWESGVMVPELFGANPQTGVDNTTAFERMAVAINTLKPSIIRFAKDVIYEVFPNDTAIATGVGGNLMPIIGLNNFVWDFNGATLKTTFTSTALQPVVLFFTQCSHFKVIDFKGLQVRSVAVPYVTQDDLQTYWFVLKDGCTDFDIENINITGGIEGVAIIRNIQTNTAACERGRITGKFTNVFYPVSLQNTGSDMYINVTTYNAARSIILYGVRNIEAWINSTPSGFLQDVAIEGPAFAAVYPADIPYTANVDLHYFSAAQLGAVSSNAAMSVQIQPVDAPNLINHESYLRGIRIHFDIFNSNTGFHTVLTSGCYKKDGSGNLIIGDVAGNTIDVTVSGTLYGPLVVGNMLFRLGLEVDGFTSNSITHFNIRDVMAAQTAQTIQVGKYTGALIENCTIPGVTINIDAGGGANRVAIISTLATNQADRYSHIPNQV